MQVDDLAAWLPERIIQVEREQAEAWGNMPAGFHVENEDILGRFFDDVKAAVSGTDPDKRQEQT